MSRSLHPAACDLRGFRWSLQAVERRLDGEVESARLALARLEQQSHTLAEAARSRAAHREAQEALARESVRRDVLAGAHAVRYLAGLQAQKVAAQSAEQALRQRVTDAREACVQRQRYLASVQELRLAAQRDHALAQRRRESREADAAWLVLAQLRRVRERRDAGGAR